MLGEIASFIAIAMARLILGDETAAQLCRSFGMSGELGRSTGREHVVDYGVLGSLVRAMGKTTRLETSDAASLRRQTALWLVSRIALRDATVCTLTDRSGPSRVGDTKSGCDLGFLSPHYP